MMSITKFPSPTGSTTQRSSEVTFTIETAHFGSSPAFIEDARRQIDDEQAKARTAASRDAKAAASDLSRSREHFKKTLVY
jgi:hypothetical protein